MVQYYMYMCPRQSRILAPPIEATSGPKGRKIIFNDVLEESFNELKRMVYAENLLSYPYWKIPFTIYTYASDKYLGAVIR